VGYVVDERLARRRQHAVAGEDLLVGRLDAHGREVAELLDARGAEELALVASTSVPSRFTMAPAGR
jgi:hypothetical protein